MRLRVREAGAVFRRHSIENSSSVGLIFGILWGCTAFGNRFGDIPSNKKKDMEHPSSYRALTGLLLFVVVVLLFVYIFAHVVFSAIVFNAWGYAGVLVYVFATPTPPIL